MLLQEIAEKFQRFRRIEHKWMLNEDLINSEMHCSVSRVIDLHGPLVVDWYSRNRSLVVPLLNRQREMVSTRSRARSFRYLLTVGDAFEYQPQQFPYCFLIEQQRGYLFKDGFDGTTHLRELSMTVILRMVHCGRLIGGIHWKAFLFLRCFFQQHLTDAVLQRERRSCSSKRVSSNLQPERKILWIWCRQRSLGWK